MRYATAWHDRRRRIIALLVALAAWGPLLFLADLLGRSTATAAVIVTSTAALSGSAVWLVLFRCPRCGRRFHQSRSRASRCHHCDLLAWEGEKRWP